MTTTATAAETRTALYRFYDERMELLYVGITNDPWRRWREHVLTQPWYPQARHWTVTFYDTEPDARRAELKAIRGEAPRFNVADLPAPVPAGFSVRHSVVVAVCFVLVMLPQVIAIPMIIWHLRMPEAASTPMLLLAMLALVVLCLVFFTSQIRDFLAWIDRHVLETAHERKRPDIIRVRLRLYQFHGAEFAPITYRRALLTMLAPPPSTSTAAARR